MKTQAQLQAIADKFNANHPIGTHVTRYKLINPLQEGERTQTRSEAWIMGGHSVMVMVNGVSGGVCVESVVPLDVTENYSQLLNDKTKCCDLTQSQIKGHHDLCDLASENGHASLESCLNDGNFWNSTVAEVAEMLIPSAIKFSKTATGHGEIFKGNFTDSNENEFTIEVNLDKNYAQIIDADSRCESWEKDQDGEWNENGKGESVTDSWNDADFDEVDGALKSL